MQANIFISLNFFNDLVMPDKDNKDKIFDYYREDNVLLTNYLNKDLKNPRLSEKKLILK